MKIISHRGNNVSNYKQNTKEALLYALDLNYIDGIEFDVRITKDEEIVIIHDPIIDFVSNGHGIVKKMKYKKLLKYNFGTKESPSQICRLDDLLENIKTNKILLIDIKEESNDYKIIDKLLKIINKYNLNIYLASFNYELVKYLNKKYDKVGLIIGDLINNKKLYNHFSFNILSYKYKDIISKKETFLWTINEKKENLNKFNIITDKPFLFKD